MVTILPPKTNVGTQIGNALGIGLQEGMGQGLQRGMLQQALGKIKDIGGKDPLQTTLAFLEATAGIPGAEKYVGSVLPMVLQQAQRKSSTEDSPVGKGSEPEQYPSVTELVPPSQPGPISDPNSPPSFSAPYGPEQIQRIRIMARQKGYTPEMEERMVQDATEMNQNARLGYQDIVSSYEAQQKARQDRIENQRQFETYIREHAGEFSSPDEMQLALQRSEQYQNEPSFAARLAKTKEAVRPYQAAKSALKTVLKRPLFGMNKDQLGLARDRAQMMVDSGQKDQLRLMIADAGHGDIEEALLLNPLNSDTERKLNSIVPFSDPLSSVKNVDADSPGYNQQLEQGQKRRSKQEDVALSIIKQAIVPGTNREPGTNLLLLRKQLMNKGLDYAEAGKLIDRAVKESGVKLDPHQQIDWQKLGYPPLGGDAYLQNVLEYVIFGKE